MSKRTQADLVKEMKEQELKPIVVKLTLPGIERLHLKEPDDIAIALSNVFRSQPNIKKLEWVIGEYIEITAFS